MHEKGFADLYKEASNVKQKSGNIDFDDEQTKTNPEDPMVIIFGIGKLPLSSLKKDIERKFKDLPNLAKRDQWKFIYKQIGKMTDYTDSFESVLQSYVRAVIQVEEEMSKPAYKRRITTLKNKKRRKELFGV